MTSVIIPVKDGAATIGKAIESAIHQADEIIVIDDGSTDNLGNALSPFNVRLFRNKGPQGPGPASNLGLEQAKGDFVLFLDADDRLGKNQIDVLKDAILRTDADMDWCPKLFKTPGHCRIIFPEDWLEFFLVGECLPMHSMLFRREKIPCFDPAFSLEDREWQSRMLVSGMKAAPASGTCCLYDWSGPKERYENFRADRLKIRKRMMDWLQGDCPSRYAHANLYGALQETFQWGMEVPELSIRLLARAFAMLPGGLPDTRSPCYQGIICRASRLWHGVQEHPLLKKTLERLPRPEKRIRATEQHRVSASPELRRLAESSFPDVFAKCPRAQLR